jgi:hypothetical protein
MDLSPNNLARENQYRQGKKYSDDVAAKAVHGNANKTQLTSNPFVTEFEYGVAGQGYWDYNHMVLQLEDCIDMLHVLQGPDKYDYMFLFDHLSGHDKQRPDGLSVTRLTKYFWGAQAKMRDTLLDNNKLFGTYPQSATDGQLFLGDIPNKCNINQPTKDHITFQLKRERDNAMIVQQGKYTPRTRQKK